MGLRAGEWAARKRGTEFPAESGDIEQDSSECGLETRISNFSQLKLVDKVGNKEMEKETRVGEFVGRHRRVRGSRGQERDRGASVLKDDVADGRKVSFENVKLSSSSEGSSGLGKCLLVAFGQLGNKVIEGMVRRGPLGGMIGKESSWLARNGSGNLGFDAVLVPALAKVVYCGIDGIEED